MDPITSAVIFIFILLYSVIFHEIAHGLMAERLGDSTARFAGRLTLNPIPHIDPIGSILLPFILYLSGLPVLGAAKPVPVDYRNLKDIKMGMILVSVAGPVTNFILAILAALVYRFMPNISALGQDLLFLTVHLNLILGLFNLIPIPPLDGSKILAGILGYINHDWMYKFLTLERLGFALILLLIIIPGILVSVLIPPYEYLWHLFLGANVPTFFQ